MPELLGSISRWNDKAFEVVIDSFGKLIRIRCNHTLWANIKKNHKIGDFVQVDYTLEGQGEIKVARSMIKREDLRG